MIRLLAYTAIITACVLASCQAPPGDFAGAAAVWTMSGTTDGTSVLVPRGEVQFVTLEGDHEHDSRGRGGDGMVARLDGGWLDAGQGEAGEVNLTGKNVSILVRMKADRVEGFSPVVTKAGGDQNVAYIIALDREGGHTYIRSMMGSDDIAGAHLLKHKLEPGEETRWHDIVVRFDGKRSELWIDGALRDDEVTVGSIRDWNRRPLLIGAQYSPADGYEENDDVLPQATFRGEVDHVAMWNRCLSDTEIARFSGVESLVDGRPEYYSETYRPQFHFSAKKNWLNDPNGLVYYDGVYHLFFQYMPPHRPGAYKDWGHAVSTDLVHWEQTPDHITPHSVWAGCWSGSAVVDHNNVAGFQKGDKKAIIAFITNGGNPADGRGPMCTQCIAYSTDGGRTFTYYDQNPVIRNINAANRDPKVVWDEGSKKWIMSLYMDRGNDFGLFTSDNLKDWTHVSTFTLDGVAECPGFIPLPVDGDPANTKWLFFGANGNYRIGLFDGVKFIPETEVLRGDRGRNFYAAMTWNNAPEGRCIHIAWMPTDGFQSTHYPDAPWEQQMNFPTELTLRSTPQGVRVFRMPVREIAGLWDETVTVNRVVAPGENPLAELDGDLYDMSFEVEAGVSFDIAVRGATIRYDAAGQTVSCKGPTVREPMASLGEGPLKARDKKVRLRVLVDRTSIEIYGDDGGTVITSNFMPAVENRHYAFTSGSEAVVDATIHSLKSAWNR